jgi:hypothetical protein
MEPVRIIFTKEYMHPWMLSYYIERFSTLMARLEISLQIPQILAAGIDPQELRLYQGSRNLWEGLLEPALIQQLPFKEKSEEPYLEIQQWIPLTSSEKSVQEDFFRHLNRVKRPEIWIVGPTPKLFFDIYSEHFLKVSSITFKSPGEMTVDIGSGVGEVIHELRYGHRREQRERERHEEEMKQKRLETERLKQEVLSKMLDYAKKMKETDVKVSIQGNLAETIKITVDNLEVLNEKARATLQLPESRQPDNSEQIE